MEINEWALLKDPFGIKITDFQALIKEAFDGWNALEEPRYLQEDSLDKAHELFSALAEESQEEMNLAMLFLYTVISNDPEDTHFLGDVYQFYFSNMNGAEQSYRFYGADAKDHYPELSREVISRYLKHTSKADFTNDGKVYVELSKEDPDLHKVDLLGMIITELKESGEISDDLYDELFGELEGPLTKWYSYSYPRIEEADSYDTVRSIAETAFRYKAYRTCLRLAPIHMISGKDTRSHFDDSLIFAGKVLYRLGYDEFAKNCFQRADANTDHSCWTSEDDEYRVLLDKETKLTVPKWASEYDKVIEEKLENDQACLVDGDQMIKADADYKKEYKKVFKARENHLKKVLPVFTDEYEHAEKLTREALTNKADELIKLLGDQCRDTREYVLAYCLKAEGLLEQQKTEDAGIILDQAYRLKEGKYCSRLLNDYADLAKALHNEGEEKAYRFRSKLLRTE